MQKSTSCQRAEQIGLFLPERPTDDILHDRLADRIEQFNATTDPAERVELHEEITRLRRILGVVR